MPFTITATNNSMEVVSLSRIRQRVPWKNALSLS
jgi:hypothetical protein